MKKKNLNRMKRLLTALIIVILLNAVLLLLLNVFKNTADSAGEHSQNSASSTAKDFAENFSGGPDDLNEGNSLETAGKLPDDSKEPDSGNLSETAGDEPESTTDFSEASDSEKLPDTAGDEPGSTTDFSEASDSEKLPETAGDEPGSTTDFSEASDSEKLPETAGDEPESTTDFSEASDSEKLPDTAGDEPGSTTDFSEASDSKNLPEPAEGASENQADKIPSSEILVFPTQPSSTSGASDLDDADTDTVTICLMGDLMCLAGQQYTAERSDGTHDYTDSFSLLRDTFASFDFVVGNLETTLSESNPYSTKEREVNEQPNCNAPADYLASLKWAGITHLVTANNHSLDGGLIGVEETIAHLDEYGIPHTGTYRLDDTGKRYMMLEKNGIRIAVLAFTELINQRALVTSAQLARIIDSYSRADVTDRIAQARADGADFVIVYEHWGSENVHEVRDYQKSHAKEIAEAGADLIIGSHPHCLQEMENITTQDGRSVLCFYSLGNVVSSMTRDINHDTVFVQVCLKRGVQENISNPASGSVSISSLTLLPCHVLTVLDGHYRVITPVDYKTENKTAAAELAAARDRIESHYQIH